MKKFVLLLILRLYVLFHPVEASSQPSGKVDFDKKIAEFTPTGLSQKPVGNRGGNDAKDENLKGKISIVKVEGNIPGQARNIYFVSHYNRSGNLIKHVQFDEGYPQIINAYGYVDGKRVFLTSVVKYADGEKPPSQNTSIKRNADENSKSPALPVDRRYNVRMEYVYDPRGRLLEYRSYKNTGELWLRETCVYEGNRRHEKWYAPDGDMLTNATYVLAPNGDDIEQLFYAGDKVVNRYIVEREYDSKGNWIIKRTFEVITDKNGQIRKPLWGIAYRTLTYFQ